ncbi:MAG: alanine dehydrogenase [Gammaproteobacteria bacterium]|jgi:alanine dehydrogenase
MKIGVPVEIKSDEYRVAMRPVGVELLVGDGHTVLIQSGAGLGSGYEDSDYSNAGGLIVPDADAIYAEADLVVKVKEPLPEEIDKLRPGQILFCYFHFASSRELTAGCLARKISAVAYETLVDEHGKLPLLTPMSEVAGKMAIQQAAKYLERPMNGRGILLGGVTGVATADVLILGGGTVGTNAARVAAGLRANVVVMDINLDRLRYLDEIMPDNVTTVYCDPHAVEHYALQADVIVGAILVPGSRADQLINRQLLRRMKRGSVFVDVCIDQGGCSDTSRPTTHHDPVYVEEDVVHYCVTNMPGAVSRTSTQALCNATLPYTREIASLGLDAFIARSEGRKSALNMRDGSILHPGVRETFPDL